MSIAETVVHYRTPSSPLWCPALIIIRTFSYMFHTCLVGIIAVVRLRTVAFTIAWRLSWTKARICIALAIILSSVIAALFGCRNESSEMILCLNIPLKTRSGGDTWIWKLTMGISFTVFALLIACYLAIHIRVQKHKMKVATTQHLSQPQTYKNLLNNTAANIKHQTF